MKTFFLFLAAGLVLSSGSALAEIEVKNTKGDLMKIEVLAFTASSGNVRIKRLPDGAVFNVKIKVFDPDSQKKIREAAPKPLPKLDIKVSAGARRTDDRNSGFMESQKITASVEVKNISRDIDLPETKVTILLVGRNTSRFADRDQDGAKILSKQSASGSAAAGDSIKFEFKPVTTKYDEDKDSSNSGGWDYDGYLLILQDKDGNVFDARCSIGPAQTLLLKDPAALKKAATYQEGAEMDRTLVPSQRSRVKVLD